jgi:hypothetical protein
LTLAEWNPVWHKANNAADKASDKNSDVSGSKETKHNNALAVDNTAVATRDVNALTPEDATSTGSNSPPLLSSLTSPETFLVDTPAAPHHVLLNKGATSCITNPDAALQMPTPSIGALPTDDDDPMATPNRAISAHFSELDHQQHAIGDKYNAFHTLLVTAQATFDASAIELQVRSAIGAHTAPFLELIS